MALYHFSVKQVSRGKGQTVVNSAAYISGQKLYNDYYGQVHDYTRKSGVMFAEILKPDYVPERLSDRETLWNEVERAEKGKRAQLAYSFDIALQNELTLEENIQLAREFSQSSKDRVEGFQEEITKNHPNVSVVSVDYQPSKDDDPTEEESIEAVLEKYPDL